MYFKIRISHSCRHNTRRSESRRNIRGSKQYTSGLIWSRPLPPIGQLFIPPWLILPKTLLEFNPNPILEIYYYWRISIFLFFYFVKEALISIELLSIIILNNTKSAENRFRISYLRVQIFNTSSFAIPLLNILGLSFLLKSYSHYLCR